MSKSIIIIELFLILINSQTITITDQCTCIQLYIEEDCIAKPECEWDSLKKLCIASTTPGNPITEAATYCNQFASMASECAGSYPCAWYGSQCTYFTGCTAYTYDTNEKCLAVSSRCFTDGLHCVEKDSCSSYKTQKSCIINNNGKFCFWNNQDTTKSKCEDIDDCLKLPSTLNTDTLCRGQLNKCTASSTGGCIESGINCSDQLAEISCVQNKDRSQNCFWKEGKCWDKTCDNAPTLLITDKSCKEFLSPCTTKENGGCVKRGLCGDAKIQAACYADQYGKDCFWTGQVCLNKICINALQTNKTNLSCQQYLPNCITSGSGCVENTGCEAAKIEIACDQTQNGLKCHWDGTSCKIKNCQNAGPNYVGHNKCTVYMNTCTANGTSGCIDRNCNNAPLTLTSNDECQVYYPKGNCITKLNGGCKDNTICEAIDINSACIKDQNGGVCFWIDNQCKSKTCSNAPLENNTHELCQKYSSSCTVGSNGTCVNYTCENIQYLDICTYDFNQKPCIYKSKCFKKICAYASQSITTHEGCQLYLSSCTLSNQGTGCMDIPQNCEQITNNKSCKIRADGGKCGFLGNKCINQICSTAPVDGSYDTTLKCNQYKAGCVVNNSLDGCIDLPNTCSVRSNQQNCRAEQAVGSEAKCEWDDSTNASFPVCIDIKCENAHLVKLKDNVTQQGCWSYYSLNCVITINENVSKCMARPKVCNGLIENACNQSKVLYGDKDCFWDSESSTCKEFACSSITFSSGTIDHAACHGKINTCTLNDKKNGCMDLKAQCNQYTSPDQCQIDINKISCKWGAEGCVEKLCKDADSSYNTNELCKQFSSKCYSSNTKKCDIKKQTCAEIKDQNVCKLGTITAQFQCFWQTSTGQCQDAQFDCSLLVGDGSLTAGYCQKMNRKCSVNEAGTACIEAQEKCSNYNGNLDNCKWSFNEKYCIVFGTSCVVDCTYAPSPYNYDSCQLYNSDCTVNIEASSCVFIYNQCAAMNVANCTRSRNSGACYLNAEGVCTSATQIPVEKTNCKDITGTNLTLSYCLNISSGGNSCSVNSSQTACVEIQSDCYLYDSLSNCFYSLNDGYCTYALQLGSYFCKKKLGLTCDGLDGNSVSECQESKSNCSYSNKCTFDCSTVPGTYADVDFCLQQDGFCTAKQDGSGCTATNFTCGQLSVDSCNGSYSYNGYCYKKDSYCVVGTDSPLDPTNCETITGIRLTAKYCKGISSEKCSVNATQTSCIEIQNQCSNYTVENCFASLQYRCVVNAENNSCNNFDSNCSNIKLFGFTNNYTDYICKNYKQSCQVKSDGTGCENVPIVRPACSSFKGTNLTLYYCLEKGDLCSINKDQNACVLAKLKCSDYSIEDCGYALNEGFCFVSGNICVQSNCSDAPSSIVDTDGCQNFSKSCVFASGGCDSKGLCNSYISEDTCVTDINGQYCLWNPQSGLCVNRDCSNAEASTYFNNNNKCEKIGNCTVKANSDKTIGMGCIPKTTCHSYTIQEQCKTNNNGVKCVWNTNLEIPACADKSCSTASVLNYKDHVGCVEYQDGCTVNVVIIDGTQTPKGCVPFKVCTEYAQIQCHLSKDLNINGQNIECAWNGTKCGNKGCGTATSDVNSASLCANYWQGCTVNTTNDGCIEIPETCETMSQEQCFIDSVDRNNRQCSWIQSDQKCITKKCEDSPNFGSEADCEAYLSGCTMSMEKCKLKICEDFELKTDSQCKQALASNICTTNGTICVTRGSCDQALIEAGCVTDNNGNQCQWMTSQNQSGYCTIRKCSTAPNNLTTELQCKQYFTPQVGQCTTKKDGGCTLKGQCNTITVQDGCNIDNNNIECVWDTDKQICRPKECKDFNGKTIIECKKIRSNCTIGQNGKCAKMENCENIVLKASCIEGLNGPCLWIDKYENSDGTQGACFKYDSCKSLNWTNDKNCKWISQNCTTDGIQCIGITNCAETNTNGGCNTGTDGQCIQTISTKSSTDTICKLYTSCKVAYYLTHEQCNNANPQCTSDYKNGCIPLDSCSAYTLQNQCHINKQGVIKDQNGLITSTGLCSWDSTNNKCNDQQCIDIQLSTQYDCQAAMKTCMTDGTTCIVKGACNSYKTQNACNNALGTEGPCFWVMQSVTSAATCRSKTCSDVTNGTTNEACSLVPNCVSDGTDCINKAKCSAYTKQIGCIGTGIDGLCAWINTEVAPVTQGNCILMTGCSVAKDELFCNQAQNRCYWNSMTNLCVEHTCETYYNQQKVCKYYYTWDQTKYNICSFNDGKCKSADEMTLNQQECYFQTAYQYSWSPSVSKCALCGSNTQVNNTNNNSNNSVEHGAILPLMILIVLLGLLI